MNNLNSQRENTKSKGDFCTQKPGKNVRFKDLWYTKINLSQKYILNKKVMCLRIKLLQE